MVAAAFASAASGKSVLVFETNIKRLQLVGRVGTAAFLMGDARGDGELASGPSPHDLLGTSPCGLHRNDHEALRGTKTAHPRSCECRLPPRSCRAGSIDRTISLEGAFDQQQRQRLVQIADHCPVEKTIGAGAHINSPVSCGRLQPRPIRCPLRITCTMPKSWPFPTLIGELISARLDGSAERAALSP